jgi:hypothetical protein
VIALPEFGFVRRLRRAARCALLPLVAACAPRARPLEGVTAEPARLPNLELPREYRQTVFRWEFNEGDIVARGEGVGRVAYPDSGRVDFFLDGGIGAGRAVLIGHELLIPPSAEAFRKFFPPAPLLWATLGRIAVPPAKDTLVRVDGDTLRADIGRGDVWRVTIVKNKLARVERIGDGRIVEQLIRGLGSDSLRVRYDQLAVRRSLTIDITRSFTVPGFNAEIWSP